MQPFLQVCVPVRGSLVDHVRVHLVTVTLSTNVTCVVRLGLQLTIQLSEDLGRYLT